MLIFNNSIELYNFFDRINNVQKNYITFFFSKYFKNIKTWVDKILYRYSCNILIFKKNCSLNRANKRDPSSKVNYVRSVHRILSSIVNNAKTRTTSFVYLTPLLHFYFPLAFGGAAQSSFLKNNPREK